MTLEPKYQHILQKGDCLSMEQLKLYLHDKLPADKRFQAEKHLLECEICNDLLEGLSVYSNADDFTSAEVEVRNHIQELLLNNKRKQRSIIIRRWSVAAGIAIIVSTSTLFFIGLPGKKAQMVTVEKMDNGSGGSIIKSDSITPVLADVSIKNEKEIAVVFEDKPIELKTSHPVESQAAGKDVAEMAEVYVADSGMVETKLETDESTLAATVEISGKAEDTNVVLAAEMLSGKVSGVAVSRKLQKEKINLNTVWGIITDETGEPIIGANVTVKGTTQATITDINGNFQLNIADTNATLLISYLGYENKEVNSVRGNETKAVLEPSAMALSEVVVVGYGTQKKSITTGAVTVIEMEPDRFDPEAARRQILSDIERLKSSRDFKNDYKKIKKVAIKYLQIEDSGNALIYVNMLSQMVDNEESLTILNETLSLIRDNEYKQAIKKLKKMKE